jgi:hypothetical protein
VPALLATEALADGHGRGRSALLVARWDSGLKQRLDRLARAASQGAAAVWPSAVFARSDRGRPDLVLAADAPSRSDAWPSRPRYSARVGLSCERGHAPGQVLHALQELRSVIDDRLRADLGGRCDRAARSPPAPTS